jgi:hypothetical protein
LQTEFAVLFANLDGRGGRVQTEDLVGIPKGDGCRVVWLRIQDAMDQIGEREPSQHPEHKSGRCRSVRINHSIWTIPLADARVLEGALGLLATMGFLFGANIALADHSST